MPLPSTSTGLTITNPLVLYRALLATKRIDPDPSQHRLALHLQKLYERLKDYEPTIEYRHRLDQIGRAVNGSSSNKSTALPSDGLRDGHSTVSRGPSMWASLLAQKEKREKLELTKVLTDLETALALESPKGLMLHGEVGTGKSMLIDLFADCLPNRKKRRWHFNTFMLETFAKLEQFRRSRVFSTVYAVSENAGHHDDYSLLWLARDMISTSPILFLDEFQLPDRAASKIMTNLMTSFFQLGGVLIATSNRMPEELAKAAGMEFSPPPSRLESLGWRFGRGRGKGRSDNMFAGQGEFAGFLELLKARCEVWEMEGGRDYRRRDVEIEVAESLEDGSTEQLSEGFQGLQSPAPGNIGLGYEQSIPLASTLVGETKSRESKAAVPDYFLIKPASESSPEATNAWLAAYNTTLDRMTFESSNTNEPYLWTASTMRVYGRNVPIPRQCNGITSWTFSELCASNLGPADYITLASRYHTLILTDVPVLTLLQKNEARRFITLLDALYEARCKLLITAAAGPDDIFFPQSKPATSLTQGTSETRAEEQDATYAETFSDIYQDASAPFRPNVSSYDADTTHARLAGILAPDALEDDPPNRVTRVDTFYNSTTDSAPGFEADDEAEQRVRMQRQQTPNFTQSSLFTGEDERFAYKRASSRLWEMCSRRWWARHEPGWHRPVAAEVRRWEGATSSVPSSMSPLPADTGAARPENREGIQQSFAPDQRKDSPLFKHAYNASPFRTSRDPPPRFGMQHAWGMMRWGRKAGLWGKGVEGLEEKKKETSETEKAAENEAGSK